MYKILLDTNVLVDYALGREPGCAACGEIIAQAAGANHVLYAASTSLKDAYRLVCASLKRAERIASGSVSDARGLAAREIAWACVRQLMQTLLVVPVGQSECLDAFTLRALHDDFEDDLIVAAARKIGADFLVTGDTRLQAHAPVGCLSPRKLADFLVAESATGTP